MKIAVLFSVQLFNGTEKDGFKRSIYNEFKKETDSTCCKDNFNQGSYHAGFSHKTIFPMWKERMQMYARARSWSQKLFIGKHIWPQTRAAIYSPKLPEYSRTIHGQLSKSERYHRRNKQYQPGNTAQERRAVKKKNGHYYRSFKY
jgi:hypothetical protein